MIVTEAGICTTAPAIIQKHSGIFYSLNPGSYMQFPPERDCRQLFANKEYNGQLHALRCSTRQSGSTTHVLQSAHENVYTGFKECA